MSVASYYQTDSFEIELVFTICSNSSFITKTDSFGIANQKKNMINIDRNGAPEWLFRMKRVS
jgi:hypothetical protein